MSIITFFVILAFLCTLAVLLAGGLSMVRGGKFDWARPDAGNSPGFDCYCRFVLVLKR